MQLQPPPKTVSYHLTIDSKAEVAFLTAPNAAAKAANSIVDDKEIVVRFENAEDEGLVLTNFLARVNSELMKSGDPRRVSASAVGSPKGTVYVLNIIPIDAWLDEGPEPKIGLDEALDVVIHIQWIPPLFYFFCGPTSGGGALCSPVPAGTREQTTQRLASAGFPFTKAEQLVAAAERSQVSDTGPIRIRRANFKKLGITLQH